MLTTSQLFCVFDTNAARRLGPLSEEDWQALLTSWRSRHHRAAWVPWVLAELTGTNMRRRNLTPQDLRLMQSATSRHDALCSREILPDPYRLMWDAIWRLAGVAPRPYPLEDLTQARRRYLDAFLAARSPDQVEIPPGVPYNLVLRTPDRNRGWELIIPATFERTARAAVDRLRSEFEEGTHASRVDAAFSYFMKWLAYTLRAIQLPGQVVQRALANTTLMDLLSSPFVGGAVEGYYMAKRACGDVSRISENDGRDIAVASYLCVSELVVTDDADFARLLNEIFLQPNRVCSFNDTLAMHEVG
jgi:hypothetical protein